MQLTGILQHGMATASGLNDFDYQSLTTISMGLKNLNQIETVGKIPIPPEVMEHFNRNLIQKMFRCLYYICIRFRYKLPLYDGVISRDWTGLVDN